MSRPDYIALLDSRTPLGALVYETGSSISLAMENAGVLTMNLYLNYVVLCIRKPSELELDVTFTTSGTDRALIQVILGVSTT